MSENRRPLNLLLIEDDEDDYILIQDLLSEIRTERYNLVWVSTYGDALRSLRKGAHDVCFLDYRLGGVHNGLDLLHEKQVMDLGIPIIFLTGLREYDVDIQAMKAGVADYLVKDDLNSPLLERSIRYAMDRAKARKALEMAYNEMEQRVEERTAELTAANEALEISNERIKLFAYSVSHDLKSPAVSLHGLTRRLHDHYGDILDEKGKAYCTQILGAARQIASLVENINMFISAKESPVSIEQLDLKEILELIREEFSDQLLIRDIYWSEPDALPAIRADRLSLIRIFRNLLDNTLKYGGDGLKHVRIGFKETGEFYILSMSDDGIGIKGEDPDIFDIFKRTESSTGVEGSGIGLAIVKEIAGRHKGTVWAEAGPLKGCNICISIAKSL